MFAALAYMCLCDIIILPVLWCSLSILGSRSGKTQASNASLSEKKSINKSEIKNYKL